MKRLPYKRITVHNHPRTKGKRDKRLAEHVLIVEGVLGHNLRSTASVHHIDGDYTNNKNDNLMICDSESYHRVIHQRKLAYENTGDPSSKRCAFCGKWILPRDPEINKYKHTQCLNGGERWMHKICEQLYDRKRRKGAVQ